MLEYEKKIMISESEYKTIVDILSKKIVVETQSNYYFDTEDNLMNSKGITYRVRSKNGKYIATVKNHNLENNDCSFEENISENTEFDSNIFDAFGVSYKGVLITERIVVFKDANCEMVLDRNVYLGYVDFELEVEYCADKEEEAGFLLKSLADTLVVIGKIKDANAFLQRVNKGESKSKRFFSRLQNENN